MKYKKRHIVILFSMIWSFSFAQQYTNITTKDALPSNHVYRITQDTAGFIWMITDKGMAKYNGSEIKTFTTRNGLATNDIWQTVATPDGKVWYFSKSPKIGYIKNDSVYAFAGEVKGKIFNPLRPSIIKNDIFISDYLNFYQLKDSVWQVIKKISNKKNILFFKHKNLWGCSSNKGGTELNLIFKNKKIKKLKTNKIIERAINRGQINDSMYCWHTNKQLFFLNLNTLTSKILDIEKVVGKTKNVRFHIVNNQVQVTGNNFVLVLNKKYEIQRTVKVPKSIQSHFSFIDKKDNIWSATFSKGVYMLPKSKQKITYLLKDEKTGKIKKIDKKIVVTAYNKGFYNIDTVSKKLKLLIKRENFIYGAFNIDALNSQFFSSEKDIIQFVDGHKKTHIFFWSNGKQVNEIARSLVYNNGYLYGSMSAGLNKLDPKSLKIMTTYNQSGIRSLISFDEKLVIATSNGLKLLKKDSIFALKYDKNYNDLDKKPILSLKKINDSLLLVGTDGFGAYFTNLKTYFPIPSTEYLNINDIFFAEKAIWFATDKGVIHLKETSDKEYKIESIYNENDGLLGKNVNSVYVANDEVYISSNLGLISIPKKKKNKVSILSIYVDEVKYNNTISKKNSFEYVKSSSVDFKIETIDYSNVRKEAFKYKLLPVQKKWVTTTSNNFSIHNLAPNKYELIIVADKVQTKYNFEITPLWHQTLWAKIGFVLLGLTLFLVGLLYVRRSELSKQAKKIKTQKKLADFELHALRSQMNPHFVFNSLNAIQYYITKNEIDLSEKYLVKFARLIRMFFDFSRAKEITLSEEKKLLQSYLELEKMRFGNDFNFKFHLDRNLDMQKNTIPTMLLQPIVENAVNHGLFHNQGKGLIEIYFTFIDKKSFEVNIIDDGVGVEKSKEIQLKSLKKDQSSNKDNSTNVLNERIELLNQTKRWKIKYKQTKHSFQKQGTSVQLIFKRQDI